MKANENEEPIFNELGKNQWLSIDDLAAEGYMGVVRGYVRHGPRVRPEKDEPTTRLLKLAVAYFRSSMHRVVEHAVFHGRNDHIAAAYPEISGAFETLTGQSRSPKNCDISEFVEENLVRANDNESLYISIPALTIMKRKNNLIQGKTADNQSISPEGRHKEKGRG